MSSGWRRSFIAVLLLALAGWVHAPVLEAGPLGPDCEVLVASSRLGWPELAPGGDAGWRRFFSAAGTEGRPLAALSLAADARLWTAQGTWGGGRDGLLGLRGANLLLLLGTAFFLGCFVLRALLPWTGSEQARAAGLASAAFLLIDPLSIPAVSAPGARPLLLGALLGSAASLSFLRGRQDRSYAAVFLAAALSFACALASEVAFLLPVGLALAEYSSAHRYRPRAIRVRTSLTTLFAFGACVGLDPLLRALLGLEVGPRGIASSLASFGVLDTAFRSLLVSFERLGFAILPVNAASRGATGFILAVALLLVALQPAVQAARSAPRLWAGVLASWAVLIALAVIYRADQRVHTLDLGAAETLFPATIVMAAGLGVASTALTGRRRFVVPAVAIFLSSLLARSDARRIAEAAESGAHLRAALARARAEHGLERRILAIDPPLLVDGHPASTSRMEWMIDPALSGSGPPAEALWARGIAASAFCALARQPELDLLRSEGLIVLLPASLLEETPDPSDKTLAHVLLAPPRSSQGPSVWREEGRSPALDLVPLAVPALRAIARPATPASARPLVEWDAIGALASTGLREGVWLTGEAGPVAMFDLSRSLRWLLAERAKRIWFGAELAVIVEAQALAQLPELGGAERPQARGGSWVFRPEWARLPRPRSDEATFFLELLDLDSFESLEVEGRRRGEELAFPGAEAFAASRWREGGALAWSIEARVAGTAIARAQGR